MNPRDAARTALLDQADAAARHATGVMQVIAEREKTRVQHKTPGPVARTILARMHPRLLATAQAGHPTLCGHLSYQAPTVAFWLAYAPGKLRCAACAEAAAHRIMGTPDDHRCDHCRRVAPTIHPHAAQLPALVVDLAPWPLAALPPITVQYGLCGGCHQADLAGKDGIT